MTTFVFPALAAGGGEAGYVASFPDLPEAHASGADLGDLLANARTALMQALERLAEAGETWPQPTKLEDLAPAPGMIPFLVDVSQEDAPVRVNISIGEALLKRIDQAASARGMSRSGFIATAARRALGERAGGADFETVARKLQDEWSVLGRRISETLKPDSPLARGVNTLDERVSETIRKTADSISTAMARRAGARSRPAEAASPDDLRAE